MKTRILSQVFLLLIQGNFVMLVASDPLHPLMETHKPTEDEIKKFQQEDAPRVNAIPIKELPVAYLIVGNAALAPAFLNQYSFTAYQWKDVFVRPSDVPGLAGESNVSTSRINPIDPKRDGFTVKEIDPPIHCLNLGSGKYAVGYFDDSYGLFFRWGDLEFSRDQLPVGSESSELFLKPGSFSAVRISPPSQYMLK